MSEHEGHEARAVYDHEVEDPRLTGRRRAVADWGVGEELFDRMPRRRFRPSESPRRAVHRTGRFEPTEPRRVEEPRARTEESRVEEPRPRVEEPRARTEESRVEQPRVVEAEEPHLESPPPRVGQLRVEAEEPRLEEPSAYTSRPPEGRRTVVIRGHGADPVWTPRRRPPHTVAERLGPRPDRLAAWAVALGMLLILIAILTAHG